MLEPIHRVTPAAPEISRARADALIAWLRDYGETRIDSQLFDERRCVPPFIVMDMGNKGLFGLQAPEEFGGLALNFSDAARVIAQLTAIDISLGALVFIHNANGMRAIMGYAQEPLRAELLREMATGRVLGAFGLTEPEAPPHLMGIGARAEPQPGGGWKITGVKRWNASGWAGIYSVYARVVEPNGRLGRVNAFAMRITDPGVRMGAEALTMGVRSIMQSALHFDGAYAGPERLLGPADMGYELAEETLLVARVYLSAACLGGMKRCLQLMTRFAARRKVSSGTLIDSPITLEAINDGLMRIDALQAMLDRQLAALDRGEYPSDAATIALKILASEWIWEIADSLAQIMGARGYMEHNIVPMILRDVRMLRVGEGPNELLTLSLGRRMRAGDGLRAELRRLGAQDLDAMMLEVSDAAQARCAAPDAPFESRAAAGAWAQFVSGKAGYAAYCVAAMRDAAAAAPSARMRRALAWAEENLDRARREAMEGAPSEARVITPAEAHAIVAEFEAEIGDIQQDPPGVERALDPMLRRSEVKKGAPPAAASLSAEEKRKLAAALLKRKAAAAP